MRIADEIEKLKLSAGGPGSGPHPNGSIIKPADKHLYSGYYRPAGAKQGMNGPTVHVNVTGNSRAHAERQLKSAYGSGRISYHLASKDSAGEWRQPTVSVKENGFGALPINQWHKWPTA